MELEIPENTKTLLETIRNGVLGSDVKIPTPFGQKQMVYADYVASGKSLSFIEDYLRENVLPYYGNTHTITSFTGHQVSTFLALYTH